MRYSKFMLTPGAAGAGAALILSAQTARADFSGPYAPANWTFNADGGNGFVDTSGAPLTISLTGSDSGFGPIFTDYTIAAVAGGTWSFHWLYTTPDTGTYDSGGYLLNGAYTVLSFNDTPGASGNISIGVSAGDIIGFRAFSADGAFGPGTIAITNFSAPVPAPGSLALLGLAAAGGARRRRRE